MKTLDTRCLSPAAQETLRFPVIRAVRRRMKKAAAARTFAVSRNSIDSWLAKVAPENVNSLESKPRRRPNGACLAPYQTVITVRLISDCRSRPAQDALRDEDSPSSTATTGRTVRPASFGVDGGTLADSVRCAAG